MLGTKELGVGVIRIGVDVGGTFTDVVVTTEDGEAHSFKLPSTPHDFSEAVLSGVHSVLHSQGIDGSTVRDVVHGSTVATNAILERKGARTGLITTKGFRDVLELRRLRMPRLYDMTWKKPEPLVERVHRVEVDERVDLAGDVVRPLDMEDVKREVEALVAQGIESIAVCLLHSYANPKHESLIGDFIERAHPGVRLSLSHRVLPVIREYERTSTTVLNAYVQPAVASYLEALRSGLDGSKIVSPLLIMQSNGGVMESAAAAERPAYVVESGPAAGVIASAALARRLGLDEVIAFDMGGTTAKASLIEGGEPHFTAEFEVASGISAGSRLSSGGGYALSVPFIDLAEVGAGGGSIIWIDPAGAPKIGPSSAGADPGPVCYGKGGASPTVTDVNLLLGYLNPGGLLHGAMPLDLTGARVAFAREVSKPLGMGILEAAYGCHVLANASMIRAIKSVSVQRGRDPRDFTLVAFGGSGPVHAASIARELGIRRIIVPPRPGVFSAVGLLQARLEFHAKKTFLRRTRSIRMEELDEQLAELELEARRGLGEATIQGGAFTFEAWAEMRYVGQGFELPIKMPSRNAGWDESTRLLEEDFAHQHEVTYGHRTNNPTEIVHLRVVLREDAAIDIPIRESDTIRLGPSSEREAYFGPEYGLMATPVYPRFGLPYQSVSGPLIIEDYDATTVIPPGFAIERDEFWNLVIKEMS